jgi:beta-galactosidase beta subunit
MNRDLRVFVTLGENAFLVFFPSAPHPMIVQAQAKTELVSEDEILG